MTKKKTTTKTKAKATKPKKGVGQGKGGGRPLFDGKPEEEVLAKLKSVFKLDGTVLEACFYAEIGESTFYKYCKAHPKFVEEIKYLRKKPLLTARQTVVTNLGNPDTAKWYLTKKAKKEFGESSTIEFTPLKEAEENKDELDELLRKNNLI